MEIFKGRIQHKTDTNENWSKAKNFIPLKGEMIIYSDLRKIKFGDGITKVTELEFANATNNSGIIATDDGQGNVFFDLELTLSASDDGLGNVAIS